MRRRLQQVGGKLVGYSIFLFSFLVYFLTMDRTVSWWDCGEFIATGYGLQVGHPPGAPLYQLVTHCFMLLSFGNPALVAPLSNLVSVLCASLTVLLLFLSARLLLSRAGYSPRRSLFGAVVGALCYLFCDTAWFSAVESEVYAMAMLFCALTVWLTLRWEQRGDGRRLILVAFLLGLGICVHLMTLLVSPMLLWIILRNRRDFRPRHARILIPAALFFLLGLAPYAVIPIRAAANPPINEGHPSTYEDFKKYFQRDQYAKAPLYPRQWRDRDIANWPSWGGGDPDSFWDNTKYWFTYQLGYMYCRYLMYNYIGRLNDHWGIIVVFALPFLLGLWGMVAHRRRRRGDFRALLLLFLFGGVILNLYLNHPCYEPRERDYAYVLSFYAFAFWIAFGVASLAKGKWALLLLLAPLLMAVGNWSDHDRSRCHSVHDIAMAHLQSCDHGALLFTYGDNDTFPLWYLKHVENRRPDIDVYNVNLTGFRQVLQLLDDNDYRRPVYFSQYAYDRLKNFYPGRLRCEGFCWRLLPTPAGTGDLEPLRRHVQDSIRWHITPNEYQDRVSRSLMRVWQTNTQGL